MTRETDRDKGQRSTTGNSMPILIQQRSERESVIPDAIPIYADIFDNFPQCSGVALDLDRLSKMLLHGRIEH